MGLAVADGEEALQILDERFTRVGGALTSGPIEKFKSGRPTLSGKGQ